MIRPNVHPPPHAHLGLPAQLETRGEPRLLSRPALKDTLSILGLSPSCIAQPLAGPDAIKRPRFRSHLAIGLVIVVEVAVDRPRSSNAVASADGLTRQGHQLIRRESPRRTGRLSCRTTRGRPAARSIRASTSSVFLHGSTPGTTVPSIPGCFGTGTGLFGVRLGLDRLGFRSMWPSSEPCSYVVTRSRARSGQRLAVVPGHPGSGPARARSAWR